MYKTLTIQKHITTLLLGAVLCFGVLVLMPTSANAQITSALRDNKESNQIQINSLLEMISQLQAQLEQLKKSSGDSLVTPSIKDVETGNILLKYTVDNIASITMEPVGNTEIDAGYYLYTITLKDGTVITVKRGVRLNPNSREFLSLIAKTGFSGTLSSFNALVRENVFKDGSTIDDALDSHSVVEKEQVESAADNLFKDVTGSIKDGSAMQQIEPSYFSNLKQEVKSDPIKTPARYFSNLKQKVKSDPTRASVSNTTESLINSFVVSPFSQVKGSRVKGVSITLDRDAQLKEKFTELNEVLAKLSAKLAE